MKVKELIDALSKCDPNAPVIIETEAFAMGSSQTGMYSCGSDDNQIDTVSDLETRVVLTITKSCPQR